MNTITTSLILFFVAIVIVATLISGLIKLIFFFKQKDTYRHILKFGLLGELAGIVILFIVWLLYRQGINNLAEPETFITIPVYSMLAGQLTGLIIIFHRRQKIKSEQTKQ